MAKETFTMAQHSNAVVDGCSKAMNTSPVVLLYNVATLGEPQ
jgi:hypothetical protein